MSELGINLELVSEAMEAVREQQYIVMMAHIGESDVAFSRPIYRDGGMTFEYRAIKRGEEAPQDWFVVPTQDMAFPDAD